MLSALTNERSNMNGGLQKSVSLGLRRCVHMNKTCRRGLSKTDLIVGIAAGFVLLSLMCMGLVTLIGYGIREPAVRKAQCQNNLHQIGIALKRYEVTGREPIDPRRLRESLEPYLDDTSVFACPEADGSATVSYGANPHVSMMGAGRRAQDRHDGCRRESLRSRPPGRTRSTSRGVSTCYRPATSRRYRQRAVLRRARGEPDHSRHRSLRCI